MRPIQVSAHSDRQDSLGIADQALVGGRDNPRNRIRTSSHRRQQTLHGATLTPYPVLAAKPIRPLHFISRRRLHKHMSKRRTRLLHSLRWGSSGVFLVLLPRFRVGVRRTLLCAGNRRQTLRFGSTLDALLLRQYAVGIGERGKHGARQQLRP